MELTRTLLRLLQKTFQYPMIQCVVRGSRCSVLRWVRRICATVHAARAHTQPAAPFLGRWMKFLGTQFPMSSANSSRTNLVQLAKRVGSDQVIMCVQLAPRAVNVSAHAHT